MIKHYSYSVKDELVKYFPGDTITKMRTCEMERIENAYTPALTWARADSMALDIFLKSYFLKETILCDDYIAYIVQYKSKIYAFLSFMLLEDNGPSAEYAYRLCSEWEAKGYECVILFNRVNIRKHNDGSFSFCNYTNSQHIISPIRVNDEYIFISHTEPFWIHAEALFYSAVTSGRMSEYESLFTENAVVSRCPNRSAYEIANDKFEKAKEIASGITNIKAYLEGRQLPYMAYIRSKDSPCYRFCSVTDKDYYVLLVNYSNQICEVVVEPLKETDHVIPVPHEQIPLPLQMPSLTSVRPLDIKTMHAYAVRLTYSDGCVKNYYMHSFKTTETEDSVSIDGYQFDERVLQSVHYVSDGIAFSNSYFIPAHILYYRGFPQLIPERLNTTVFDNGNIKINGLYRVPLKIRRHLSQTYAPRDDAYWGADDTLLDDNGDRLNDYSGYMPCSDNPSIIYTQSEANGKIGYLKKDGSWLMPPVLSTGEDYDGDHCVKVKYRGKQYLLNENGELIPIDFKINTRNFSCGLCEISIKDHEGDVTYPEEDYFDELFPGLWGFIDKFGKIVIEPQYVFTSGFGRIENRAFVAKVINGETLWGLIDNKGKEIIPCIYPNLATHSGTAVNFQREKYGNYGIMDSDGNVIMEPRYSYIYEYDSRHNLIAAGNEHEKYGVAKISDGKIIVPFEYCYVGFEDDYIECETVYGETVCYSYDGNRLSDDFNPRRWKRNGNFGVWKDHKCGVINKDGEVIVPFIFEKYNHIDYYERGYIVTGTKGKYGLSKLDGSVILPQKYSDISLTDNFIIASMDTETNWNIHDELYLTDGTPVFDDLYREVRIKGDLLTRETPLGTEHYRITVQNK